MLFGMSNVMSDSPLLDFVDKATLSWVRKLSLVAIPTLRMHAGGDQKLVGSSASTYVHLREICTSRRCPQCAAMEEREAP
jgi:hypothetical protein